MWGRKLEMGVSVQSVEDLIRNEFMPVIRELVVAKIEDAKNEIVEQNLSVHMQYLHTLIDLKTAGINCDPEIEDVLKKVHKQMGYSDE